jgi:hypothetical protein
MVRTGAIGPREASSLEVLSRDIVGLKAGLSSKVACHGLELHALFVCAVVLYVDVGYDHNSAVVRIALRHVSSRRGVHLLATHSWLPACRE